MATKGGVTSEASQLGRCGGALKRAGVLGVGLVEPADGFTSWLSRPWYPQRWRNFHWLRIRLNFVNIDQIFMSNVVFTARLMSLLGGFTSLFGVFFN